MIPGSHDGLAPRCDGAAGTVALALPAMSAWIVRIFGVLGIGAALAIGLPEAAQAAQPVPARVEVAGDLATAGRIAVLVPGADTTAANFDTGLGGVQRRAPGWQAHQLAAAAGSGTAVVAWLGYQTPSGIGRAAIRSERAQAGADALVRYVSGLTADHPQSTVVLIGHSYGTVVIGRAASRLPAQVTDIVALGSPGMDVTRAADLHTTARVWAGSDPGDWTLRLPDLRLFGAGHGTNPTRAGFGAHLLDVHDAVGHDGYFVPGTRSLQSIAEVVR